MNANIKYSKGEKIGNCIYVNDVDPCIRNDGRRVRKALFICACGNTFESVIGNVKNGNVISCGCSKIKHGMSGHRVYKIWASIKARCHNRNARQYKDYGERGIEMSDKWRNDFRTFYNYVISLPGYGTDGLTLDRIDNDGNYESGNLRWATWSTQNKNKRLYKSSVSHRWIYEFVLSYKNKNYRYYRVIIKGKYIKSVNNINDAIKYRDQHIVDSLQSIT